MGGAILEKNGVKSFKNKRGGNFQKERGIKKKPIKKEKRRFLKNLIKLG